MISDKIALAGTILSITMMKVIIPFYLVLLRAMATTSPNIQVRNEPGGVYFCNGPGWTICWWMGPESQPVGNVVTQSAFSCRNIGAQFNAFGPDKGALCAVFE